MKTTPRVLLKILLKTNWTMRFILFLLSPRIVIHSTRLPYRIVSPNLTTAAICGRPIWPPVLNYRFTLLYKPVTGFLDRAKTRPLPRLVIKPPLPLLVHIERSKGGRGENVCVCVCVRACARALIALVRPDPFSRDISSLVLIPE